MGMARRPLSSQARRALRAGMLRATILVLIVTATVSWAQAFQNRVNWGGLLAVWAMAAVGFAWVEHRVLACRQRRAAQRAATGGWRKRSGD
ncbi:hypothetical protein Dshi_1018 [Dinoroseobacter shibae DFL 12 = DSM 16493]|jgi:hypothetical protein|uniref:Uncharacterized protein n=2 Tax=Dinoroseobacter shibae TaxID=215813 RepID=A8LSE6_DINSH|nr:hypothetical protein Dshi_1018 [Dinoroseobacter shibae DFL 12 = DSM 16493]